jgi:hypothetical protein
MGGRLLPDTSPRRTGIGLQDSAYIASPDRGTGGYEIMTDRVGGFLARWRHWREGFEQRIGPAVRRYWALYRNFDDSSITSPGQEWRDRTVIPESFKIIESVVPRKVLSLWGQPEPFGVRGRGYRDESYEDMVRELIQQVLDDIGNGDPRAESFYKKLIDGERYKQIMGHVFWKVWWRHDQAWLRTQAKDETGKWKPIEVLETLYENVDLTWLGLDSIAIDLSGQRRWMIEKVITSHEKLVEENDIYRAQNGVDLYQNLDLIEAGRYQTSPVQRDSYEEPRVTERWPLSDGRILSNPGEHQVELWLCWDNTRRTLTKIANRSVELDHGLAPTPYGWDPYLSIPAIPVPKRVYGDSRLNWTGPLSRYQTRLARARADEILLNIFQQYIYREGVLRGAQWFWRPGGSMPLDSTNDERPLSDNIMLIPRRPVMPEAWQEEGYRQQQAEAAAGTDQLSMGLEATQKSRDVAATEIQQRVLQGSTRHELERLYDEFAFKRPLLNMIFDLLRQNLTKPKMLRILDDQEGAEDGSYQMIDLSQLDRPIDIVITGGVLDSSHAEKLAEIRELVNLTGNPVFMPLLKAREILVAMLKNTSALRRNTKRFVVTPEQQEQMMQQQQALAMGAGPGPTSGPKPAAGQPVAGLGGASPGGAMSSPGGQSLPKASSSEGEIEV